MAPRKPKNPAMAAPMVLISEKENIAEENPSVKSPIKRKKKALADKNSASLEAELEAMTLKLKEVCLQKDLAERMLQEKEEILKQKDEELAMRELEQSKLQKQFQHLKKIKEFKPTLSLPMKASENDNLSDEKAKKKKDPNKPKKPLSAFILWCKDHREEVKAQHPEASFTEMSALLSEKWKAVTDAEKKPYEEHYRQEKEEYLKLVGEEKRVTKGLKLLREEKTQRTAMELMDQYMEYLKETENNSGKTKSKKDKDPDKPKQATTAFFAFLHERRAALDGEKYNAVDLSKMLGEEWKNMTGEMRAPYEQIAAEDKARHAEEMEVYKKKKAEEAILVEQELKEKKELERLCGMQLLKQKEKADEVKKVIKEQGLQKKKEKLQSHDPNKPKKPLSSYMMFSQECRSIVRNEMPKASFSEITNLLSARWKVLNDAERKVWSDKAAVAMEKYKMEMEAYKKTHAMSPIQSSSASSS